MAPSRSRLVALASAAVLVFVLAGCGTSGGKEAADDPTTTEAEATTTTDTDTTAVDTTEVETTDVETTEAENPGDDELCEPLKVLSDYDIESAKLINAGDWAAIQAYFVDHTDDVLAAYDDAIALDTDLTSDLEELRSVTEGTADLAASSSSLDELASELLADPNIASAGEAGFNVNDFAEANCGFSTGGNGQ